MYPQTDTQIWLKPSNRKSTIDLDPAYTYMNFYIYIGVGVRSSVSSPFLRELNEVALPIILL